MNRDDLERLVRSWRNRIVAREVLFALAAAGATASLLIWQRQALFWPVAVALVGTLAVRLAFSRPWELDAAALGRHLDRTHPELEESTTLFLRSPEDLTLLERMQRHRIATRLAEPSRKPPGGPPPGFLRRALFCLDVGALLFVLALVFSGRHDQRQEVFQRDAATKPADATARQPPAAPRIIGNTFTVTPPAYTARPAHRADGLAVEAEEDARVQWSVTLDQPVRDAHLSAGATNVPLSPVDGNRWEGSAEVRESRLFSLVGTSPDGTPWNPPEIFSVKVLKDQPPIVRLVQPAQTRTEIVPPAPRSIPIEATISDDYAVVEARLVVTVAKGSGESVKFREQRLPFDTDAPGDSPTTHRFTKALDLAALGMEPGDELYFYVEAADNRQPAANHARSETRFLTLRGPEERKTSVGRGVAGVNLVPQYFRSERQLIIDTEKLVADRPTLPAADFRNRANDLGADQALLRLRYGRFLGEDQEEGLFTDHKETPLNPLQAAPPEHAAGPRAAASVAQRFQQEHAEQDQGGGSEDAAPGAPVDRSVPPTAEQVRQPFVDFHDLHDKNTFFDGNTQGTMRDALAAMWGAERFLRTARPQEALAPEHRALDILKDLQQSARAYVQHVGFEAPPLKVAERRLKGDASDVPLRSSTPASHPSENSQAEKIRTALATLSPGRMLSAEAAAEVELVLLDAATRQPEEFLPGLQALRQTRAGKGSAGDLLAVQEALLRLLPSAQPLPTRAEEPPSALSARYFQALQTPEAPR